MLINAHEMFSSAQPLQAIGDTVSCIIDTGPPSNLLGVERPFLHVQAAKTPPRSDGEALLEVGLLHSDDGQRFTWVVSPVQAQRISHPIAWASPHMRLPEGLGRFLMLRYRVTGAPLTGGALTAFPSNEMAEQPRRELRPNATATPLQV